MDGSFRSPILQRTRGDGEGDGVGGSEADRRSGHERHSPCHPRDVTTALEAQAQVGSVAHRHRHGHLDSTPMGSMSSTTPASFSPRSPTRASQGHALALALARANSDAALGSSFHAPLSFASPGRNTNAGISNTGSGHHRRHRQHHVHAAPASPPLQSPPGPSSLHHNSVAHHHDDTANRHHQPQAFAHAHAHAQGLNSPTAAAAAASVRIASTYMASSSSTPVGVGGPSPLPPPSASSNASTSNGHNHHHHHHHHHHQHSATPVSPPRHPSASTPSNYYPPPVSSTESHPQSHHHARDKPASGRVYDPTTDTTKERRVSDSWHNTPQNSTPKAARDSYPYDRTSVDQQHHSSSYYGNKNGQYTSPRQPYNRPRSPLSHSHPSLPAGSHSPPSRTAQLTSPSPRHVPAATLNSTTNGFSAMSSTVKSEPRAASPSKPVPATSTNTPSRSADPMSFSNILSSAEPAPKPAPEPRAPSSEALKPEQDGDTEAEAEKDVETEPEPNPARKAEPVARKKPGRRPTKGRASDIRDAEAPKSKRRSSVKKESPQPRSASKRLANGQPKATKTWSSDMEKKISNSETQIENDTSSFDPTEFDEQEYKERAHKRRRVMIEFDAEQGRLRRDEYTKSAAKKLTLHSELGKRRYDDVFYDQALNEVREQELFAEKERKKDMQRKRRREKSMAVTIELKEAALARANAAEDEHERQKHLRDAERASKKAQQTKLILQKGIKGPARNLELNLEGGTMSSFLASDAETPKKGRGKGGRLKKSKEQKKAEKDSAEAAQALLDAGKELPPKEESKVRIKIKGRPKDKDKDKDKDNEKIKESKEPAKEKKDDVSELEKKFTSKGYNQIYEQIWRDMARKDVNKTFKMAVDSYATKGSNLKKTAILASKEAKRWQLRTNKGTKDLQARAKRVMRDMMGFWKRNEREERDLRKAAEKQEIENARREEADREAARQKRKLNFLISQTELYSHFIGKKIKTDEVERSTDNPEIAQPSSEIPQNKLDIAEPDGPVGDKVTDFENLDFDNADETQLQAAAMANAQNAIAEAQKKARAFNNEGDLDMDEEGEMNFQNPTGLGEMDVEQPKLINAQLKEYQLKGLNWLVNLYEQGINGILADEMGLGKTVQSISVMAYLAEKHDIWGPFLVVAPASTLHNWQQEIAKFVPEFKILPYWGSAPDRKVLRKFWDRKHSTYRKDAAFHVCVTSYQLVVSDVAYFQKMRWQYMILDEAQAIKSSQSSRWKSLLGFHCRNRLLLTGTPIQNNMQELWALLHFIMPSLFDSHDEFSEWFSKDIESHAQSNTKLNEDQLKRLHMILKPFMLRRVKKHVQKELGDKIEMDVFCKLTYRQRAYYANLRNQINIMDLVEKATMGDDQDSGTLMNLVMQFRKVCNHPDLFERAEVTAPFSFAYFAETASFVREGSTVTAGYSTRSLIDFELPSLIWTQGGRLDKASSDNPRAGWRNKALNHMMNIWSPEHVHENAQESKTFSWLRFADLSAGDVYKATHESLFTRATNELRRGDRIGQMSIIYDEEEDKKFTPAHALFKICARGNRCPLAETTREGILHNLMNVARENYRDSGLTRLEIAGRSRAWAPPVEVSCNSMSAVKERQEMMFNPAVRKALYGPNFAEERSLVEQKVSPERYPSRSLLPKPDSERKRFTEFVVPSMRKFVTDSGKLAKLDELLFKLKNEGHRVLLYFQMTRMIDMMEEYLTYRNYKYCRLDGSTKLEDRRDTVHDFQTRPEIFIFLLSTRAGGLGINLTSADTVIFYDSDWNPTIDSQAMDRAHRLGQTKQVTVYRLITRGTIEERIRKRALQKEEVQRVVIQGGGASVDFSGRRAPENRNRDIAMWLADDEQAEMIERREKELLESGEYDKHKKRGGKRKKAEAPASLDDMYHEGEGHFDDGSRAGASGTATPAESDTKGKRGRGKAVGKRAKTAKQRLAIADGMVDA
ncbi:putative DNA helicase ino80 [Metarhizium rileyi]|uniref:Chromatin-remodeling ATPase INO80 n=1 Tax=Metarhizium rileyi (strain RCEF 4871) TaxID=1649241 RepID=A0A5C6GNH2_METRR|nr:putative DNA helicase ino80 [Metarhizium rileyi]